MKLDGEHVNALVLEGGGTSVLSFYIGMLQSWNVEPPDLPCNIAGSSAGAIALALYLANYVNDCDNERITTVLGQIFEVDIGNALQEEYLISYTSVMSVLREYYPRLFELTIRDAEIITNHRVTFICTLMKDEQTFETLKIDSKTHPNMTLADAAYVSSSIPLLFEVISLKGNNALDGDILPYDVYGVRETHLVCTNTGISLDIGIPILKCAIVFLTRYFRHTFSSARHHLDITHVKFDVSSSLQLTDFHQLFHKGQQFATRFSVASDESYPEHPSTTPETPPHTISPA
jgi:hypothetical protein